MIKKTREYPQCSKGELDTWLFGASQDENDERIGDNSDYDEVSDGNEDSIKNETIDHIFTLWQQITWLHSAFYYGEERYTYSRSNFLDWFLLF